MAQILDQFDREIAPHLKGDDEKKAADNFKGIVRAKVHALALDAVEEYERPPDEVVNGVVVELRDQVQGARPTRRATA